MSAFDRLTAGRPSILTKGEVEDLKARRAAAEPIQHPTPIGSEMGALKSGAAISDERRIDQIESRFKAIRERTSADHRLSALRGKTRQDFDRSR